MPSTAIEIGVVLERRPARSAWLDVIWEARSVLPEPAAAERGASLGATASGELFYGGAARLEVNTVDTGYYRDNLESGTPQIWVVLRAQDSGLPEIARVTCDPNEGEGYAGSGWDIVNVVPMPAPIAAALAAFVAEHHVDRPFIKRKRDKADPEAWPRAPGPGARPDAARPARAGAEGVSRPDDSEGGFLGRWARRKQEAQRAAREPAVARPWTPPRRPRRRSRRPICPCPRSTASCRAPMYRPSSRRMCRRRCAMRRCASSGRRTPRSAASSRWPTTSGTSTIRIRYRAGGAARHARCPPTGGTSARRT